MKPKREIIIIIWEIPSMSLIPKVLKGYILSRCSWSSAPSWTDYLQVCRSGAFRCVNTMPRVKDISNGLREAIVASRMSECVTIWSSTLHSEMVYSQIMFYNAQRNTRKRKEKEPHLRPCSPQRAYLMEFDVKSMKIQWKEVWTNTVCLEMLPGENLFCPKGASIEALKAASEETQWRGWNKAEPRSHWVDHEPLCIPETNVELADATGQWSKAVHQLKNQGLGMTASKSRS